jgi:hypothetical protein
LKARGDHPAWLKHLLTPPLARGDSAGPVLSLTAFGGQIGLVRDIAGGGHAKAPAAALIAIALATPCWRPNGVGLAGDAHRPQEAAVAV